MVVLRESYKPPSFSRPILVGCLWRPYGARELVGVWTQRLAHWAKLWRASGAGLDDDCAFGMLTMEAEAVDPRL